MCSVRSWWKEEHMPFQDSCHQVLILISFTWILEDLLPSGCHYLIIQGNSLSRYLTILIRWEKNEFLLALFWVWHILIHLTSVICRPFFCNRKSIPLTSLGDIPLSKYVDALVCLYVSVCYQIKKDSKKIFDIALSFFFLHSEFDITAYVVHVGGVYISNQQKKQWVFVTDGSIMNGLQSEKLIDSLLAICFCSPLIDHDSFPPINYNLAGSTVITIHYLIIAIWNVSVMDMDYDLFPPINF